MIFEQLKDLLAEQFGVDADTITMDNTSRVVFPLCFPKLIHGSSLSLSTILPA